MEDAAQSIAVVVFFMLCSFGLGLAVGAMISAGER